MSTGILAGYLIRKKEPGRVPPIITGGIWLLLFMLEIEVSGKILQFFPSFMAV